MSFIDVVTDVVSLAGQRTAATSTVWRDWAWQAEQALRDGPAGAENGVVRAAGEEYAAVWNPLLHQLAADVDGVGTGTTSASNVIDNADSDATAYLNAPAAVADTLSSNLSRPV
jgi:hypothetical protein